MRSGPRPQYWCKVTSLKDDKPAPCPTGALAPSSRGRAAGVVRVREAVAVGQLGAAEEEALDDRAALPGQELALLLGLIPNPADQCAGELGGVTAGHQAKWAAALITSGMSARVRQRSLSAASRSLRVAKCLFATASSASGHRCSAGCSSGV